MKITIHRKPGLYGYFLDLSVIFNGEKVCDIKRNESKDLLLPASDGVLEVKMESHAISKPLLLNASDKNGCFVCGVKLWAVLEPFDLHYLWPKKLPVFYLKRKALRPAI